MSDSTFDAARNYKRVCYREDRDLLNTELNEMQDAGAHDRTMILDRILAPGTILSGLAASASGSNVTINDGVVYMDGCAVGVPGSVLAFASPGEHTIYVDVFRRDVTASEDPTLVNPLTGEATAEREKWIATLQPRDTSGDPLPDGAKSRSVAPIYVFNRDTGEIGPAAGVAGDGGSLFPELAAALEEHKSSDDHDGRYYTKGLSDGRFAPIGHVGAGGVAQHPAATGSAAGFMSASDKTQLGNHETRIASAESALTTHRTSSDHDSRYYTKSQMDTTLAGKADDADVTAVSDDLTTHKSSSDHDSRYYTKTGSDGRYAPIGHIGAGGASQHPAATGSTAGFMASGDKIKLDGIEPGAEVNQDAISNVLVKGTTIAAASKTDTVELVEGPGVSLTPDAANKKVTIGATGLGGYTITWRHADGYDIAGFYSSGYGVGMYISPQGGLVMRAAGWNNNWMYSIYVKSLQAATISIPVPRAGRTPHMFVDGVEKPLTGGAFEWTSAAGQTYLVQFTCCLSIDPDCVDMVVIGDWIDNVKIAFDHYA